MTFTQHTSLKRVVALALSAAFLLPPGTALLTAARAQDAAPTSAPAPAAVIRIPMAPVEATPIKTVLLFPFANAIPASGSTSGFDADVVGARVEDAIKLRLNMIGRYQASSFSPQLPQIQRALTEPSATGQGVTENDLVPPYTSRLTAQRIATQIGTDGYMLGTIEALSQDPKTRNVNLTISATLYSSVTGGPVKVMAYTGHGNSYNATDDPNALLQSAINDASGHVVSALNVQAGPQKQAVAPADFKRGHRSNNGSILLGILLAVGIGLAISSSHHHHDNGSSTTPVTPVTTDPGIPAPPTGLGNGLGGGTGSGTISGGTTIQPPSPPST